MKKLIEYTCLLSLILAFSFCSNKSASSEETTALLNKLNKDIPTSLDKNLQKKINAGRKLMLNVFDEISADSELIILIESLDPNAPYFASVFASQDKSILRYEEVSEDSEGHNHSIHRISTPYFNIELIETYLANLPGAIEISTEETLIEELIIDEINEELETETESLEITVDVEEIVVENRHLLMSIYNKTTDTISVQIIE